MASFDFKAELSEQVRGAFFVGGTWVPPSSGDTIALVSPVDERPWIQAPLANAADVDRAAAAARTAFDEGEWPRMAPAERAAAMRRLSTEIQTRLPQFARLWTAEVGAPISFANMFVPTAPAIMPILSTPMHSRTAVRVGWVMRVWSASRSGPRP